jgi:hypothetical protein
LVPAVGVTLINTDWKQFRTNIFFTVEDGRLMGCSAVCGLVDTDQTIRYNTPEDIQLHTRLLHNLKHRILHLFYRMVLLELWRLINAGILFLSNTQWIYMGKYSVVLFLHVFIFVTDGGE